MKWGLLPQYYQRNYKECGGPQGLFRFVYKFFTLSFCSRYDSIQPSDATINHLVAYDKDKDLLPLILSHRDYAMEAGQGTSHTFNLAALQRQIEERFLRGRPKIVHKIEQLVFRQDSHDAAVFQTLRNRIPQVWGNEFDTFDGESCVRY